MKLDRAATYKRISNILYKDDVAVVKFHSTFIDLSIMTEQMIIYMERFMEVNPGWYEILENGIITDDPTHNDSETAKSVLEHYSQVILPKNSVETVGVKVTLDKDFEESGKFQADITIDKLLVAHDTPIRLDGDQESHDPNSSRLEQVKFWLNKGLTTSSQIAEKIGGNPSYYSRLIKQAKEQS